MRPIQLTMQAFGPYAQRTELDFAKLKEQNIFVITGPTGAGKTTIFDAICYALYGKATGERSEKGLRSDFVQEEEHLITEVIFRFAVRGKVYEVKRQPAQRLLKKSGQGFKEGAHEAELRCVEHDSFAPLSKLKEVDEKIQEILGLDYEQFRKIVMIPQGEFRRFLNAPTAEKQQILRQLFGTAFYEQVQKELSSRGRKLEQDYQQQKKQLEQDLKRIHTGQNAALQQAIQTGDSNSVLTELEQHLTASQQQLQQLEIQNQQISEQQQQLQQELERQAVFRNSSGSWSNCAESSSCWSSSVRRWSRNSSSLRRQRKPVCWNRQPRVASSRRSRWPSRNDSCNNSSNSSKGHSSRLCMDASGPRLPTDWRSSRNS